MLLESPTVDSIDELIKAAHDAIVCGDWDHAARRWDLVRQQLPDQAAAYAEGGWALRELGRFADADAILSEGMQRFPRDPGMAIHYAQVAMRPKNWDEAADRWGIVRAKFPEHPSGYQSGGWASREAKRFDEADAVLRVGMVLFPEDRWIAIHYAWVARHRPDWMEAAQRWSMVRAKFPEEVAGYVDGGWALLEVGRLEEADDVLSVAVQKFPDSGSAAFHYARAAEQQCRWRGALARWLSLRDRFPDYDDIEIQIKRTVQHIQLDELIDDEKEVLRQTGVTGDVINQQTTALQSPAEIESADVPALMAAFHSLGVNCEFGLVQRHFKCEPLGLLRWGTLSYERLIVGLMSGFADLGDPANMSTHVYPGNELMVTDGKWGFDLHTGVNEHSVQDMALFVRKMCVRIRFLKEKLIKDISDGEAIFIYQRHECLSDQEIFQLYRVLCQFGPIKLLCIRPSKPGVLDGAVARLDEGLLVGNANIREFGGTAIDLNSWVKICVAAQKAIVR